MGITVEMNELQRLALFLTPGFANHVLPPGADLQPSLLEKQRNVLQVFGGKVGMFAEPA